MILKRIWILLVMVLLIKLSDCLSTEKELKINSMVKDVFMAESAIPGVGVTIVENFGESTFFKGYGYSDIERNIPADENTKFCIASITKTFTATLVMKVLSEKFPKLGAGVVDTPLRKLHPNGTFMFSDRFRYESMSFRDLLSHRSALKTETFGSSVGAFKNPDELFFRSRYAPEVASFRTDSLYSNTLVALAGRLIAEIAEKSYVSLLQDFFDQLAMNDSAYVDAHIDCNLVANMSRGYFLENGVVRKMNSSLINRVYIDGAAGAIITTANDMAKYIKFHLNGGKVGDRQIVSKEALLWMRQPAAPIDYMQFRSVNSSMVTGIYGIGSGFFLGVFDGWDYVGHDGLWDAFQSSLRIYPQLGFGTFSISNGPIELSNRRYDHSFVQNSIFAVVNGLSDGGKIEPTDLSENKNFSVLALEALETYLAEKQSPPSLKNISQDMFVGSYGHPVEGDMDISLKNETLYMRYGTWGTGYLKQHATNPVYNVIWDSDIIQDYYFMGGGLFDTYLSFDSGNTLSIIIYGELLKFQRGVSLATLPIIPWKSESCSAEQKDAVVQ